MKNGDKLAFPGTTREETELLGFPAVSTKHHSGLTKREYFAGLAMQGLLAHTGGPSIYANTTTVSEAVYFADALLAELEKPTEK